MKIVKHLPFCLGLVALTAVSCSDNDNIITVPNENENVGKAVGNFSAAEWSPGGEKGTTTNEQGCYSNPVPQIADDADLYQTFKRGETFFERDYTLFTAPFRGLGPAWVRSGCEYCHPNYGHGKRQDRYRANEMGNGYLLVVYHPTAGTDPDGVKYAANSYVRQVTGMPQTQAMYPFKAPIDESGIHIQWNTVTSAPSGIDPTKFPDGTPLQLIYPDVTIDQMAFNTNPRPVNYEVRLESTIGMYGTGLLDAIPQDSMKAQYQRESPHVELNPAMWDAGANDWAASAWYSLADGTKRVKKFTYAMTRAALLDGPGANAIWNITNVTRFDRHYLYTTAAWAKAMSEDDEVVEAIKKEGKSATSLLHPYYGDGSEDSIRYLVGTLLALNTKAGSDTYKKYFVDMSPWNGQEEMRDEDYYAFAVWHKGLAVPQARNLDNEDVQRGKELFYKMGCTACHRPSWTIKKDESWIDPVSRKFCSLGNGMPDFSNTVIWPYTDLVQHRLYMANDIRMGWCRTTPLWGRGLSQQETGASDRLHDCRARNVEEAIVWHCYDKRSDAYHAAIQFYNLPKADRDAVVAFINAI
ncbi:MAG: di-heme oxidoredictase family protein [Prevotella sp.]